MGEKIIVLFDSFSMRADAIQYAIALAKRMDSALVFLVLLSLDSSELSCDGGSNLETRAREVLLDQMKSARQEGVIVDAEIRMGDPLSELMKFLAESRSIQALVWGGPHGMARSRRRESHWFPKIKDLVEFPVVIPSMKSQPLRPETKGEFSPGDHKQHRE